MTVQYATRYNSGMDFADSLSLYLHIPFCRHRCSYCDFNTYTTLDELQPAYAAALADELRQVGGAERRPAHTLFFGGGTPSLMTPSEMAEILTAVHGCFAVSDSAEITMEANPNTVTLDYLREMRALGINRLSFGVQSAISSELRLLDRQHDFSTAIRAVETARQAGFDNFNIDLIYGVPGQTLDSWTQSLESVLALGPAHVSLYCLTIEPGTPMQRWLRSGIMPAPDPDLAADQFEIARNRMGAAGFDHYEISNWAQPGLACEHNMTYWRNGQYLGLGAGAHGHAAGYRYHIVRQPRVYIRRIEQGGGNYPLSSAVAEKVAVDDDNRLADTVITQLRLLHEGIDLSQFESNFGMTPTEAFGDELEKLLTWELLHINEERLLLTEKGEFLSNQVFHRLI